MDRRTQPRTHLVCEVLLHCHAAGLIGGMTRDISSEGVFIAIASLGLNEYSSVDVCFLQKGQKTNNFHKINAQVVRISKTGVGLVFNKPLPPELLGQMH